MGAGPFSDTVQPGIEAFNRGDHRAVIDLLTEDVEWKRVDGLPDEGGTIYGRKAVWEHLKPEVFDRARVEPIEYVEDSETVLVHLVFMARGAGSGIELDVHAYVVYRVRDGLAWRVENWRRREDAERSCGLRLA